ncbi:putative asparagine--tRNA ligase, mitochondrial [Halotydeus destructor]|nr:putative asparagine--tRNA ligase, mitochondrial [Halotydeus destructor]
MMAFTALIRSKLPKCPKFSNLQVSKRFCSASIVRQTWGETDLQEVKPREVAIKDAIALKPSEEPIMIKGWIKFFRKMKTIGFLTVTDNMNRDFQVLLPRDQFDFNEVKINVGSSVTCIGRVVQNEGHTPDLDCQSLTLIGDCPNQLMPFNNRQKTTVEWPKLRQHLHLRPRADKIASTLRIRSQLITEVYKYMEELEYFNVTTPVLTSNDCEGAGETFQIASSTSEATDKYFQKDVHLTVSSQLHLEAMAASMNKVYCIGPAFRAESSQTKRHLAEFTMLEVEESFIESLDDLMDRAEHLTKNIAQRVLSKCCTDSEYLHKLNDKYADFKRITNDNYLRLTYDEAVDLVNKQQSLDPLEHGRDIGAYHEKVLLDYFEGIPLFITHYPSALKPFYMKRDGDRALCFDLIVRNGGEICGGSLREDNYDLLRERVEAIDALENLKWYLELRLLGSCPHGGYGLGIERFIQGITGIPNVKDTVPYPRWYHHCPL